MLWKVPFFPFAVVLLLSCCVTPVSCLVRVQLTCFSVSDAALFCLLGFPFAASQTVGNEAKLCWPAVTCRGAQKQYGGVFACCCCTQSILSLALYISFFFFSPAYIACWCIRMSERPLSVTQMVWKLVPTRSLVHSQGAASLLFRCRGALKECLSLSSLCGFEKSSTMPVLVISARGLYIRHGPCIGQSMQDPFCAEVQK